jgi:hypothetical protein
LLKELSIEQPGRFTNFVPMDLDNFHYLLSLVPPLIVKKDTTMREAVKPGETLATTLQFLATGW